MSFAVIGAAIYAVWYVEDTVAELSAASTQSTVLQTPALVEVVPEPTQTETTSPRMEELPSPARTEAETMPKPEDLALSPPPEIDQTKVKEIYWQYYAALSDLLHPPRDYYENASRLQPGFSSGRTVSKDPYSVGDRQVFRTADGRIGAVLAAVTEHAYFWLDEDLNYDLHDIEREAQRFEDDFYPIVYGLFGEEWRPGVDSDSHFSVLHLAKHSGDDELGFFSSADEYPWAVTLDSNQQEMVYLNMDILSLGSDLYHGTLIHEIQHLIQWNKDANEAIWVSEGLAQFTELFAGFDTVDTASDYLTHPEIQLNSWEFEDEDKLYAHYGASYLFMVYLWEQAGKAALSDLVEEQSDGLSGVRSVLEHFKPEVTLEQFFANWMAANYLDDLDAGREFGYANLRLYKPRAAAEITEQPFESVDELDQFGVQYVELDLTGPFTLTFAGDTTNKLLSSWNSDGGEFWYAPAPDEIDAELTAIIDLSGMEDAILEFKAWYDLEDGYDFAYVMASADQGNSWHLLDLNHGSAGDYGPAFTGKSWSETNSSNGWISESIDLSQYTGGEVMLRFELLTDSAISGGGFAVDDISIRQFTSDIESLVEVEPSSAEGFVKTGSDLPQSWAVVLIKEGEKPEVVHLELDELNQGSWTVELGEEGGVLAVSPMNLFVDTPSAYWLSVRQ